MFRHRLSPLVLCAALLGSVVTNVASAQSTAADTARATELFKAGKAAFAKGDVPEAERLFAQAFAVRKSSDIAANLGQVELEQGKYRDAAEHFAWSLANMLPSATDAQRRAVENGLARARAEVAILRLEIEPEGADVLVGAHAVGKSPITSGVYVDPGEVIISVKRDGYVSLDKRVMVGKGTEQAVEIRLNPIESEPAVASTSTSAVTTEMPSATTSPDRSEPKSLVPAYIATGVAVAGGVAGLVFTLSANSKEDDADSLSDRLRGEYGDDACARGTAPSSDCGELSGDRESVDRSRNLAIGAFIVGGVAALTAGYFYWDALSSRNTASAPTQPRWLGLRPTVEVSPPRAAATQSFKLGVSGTF